MKFRIALALLGTMILTAAEQSPKVRRVLSDPSDNICLPQIASGAGWKTIITLVNMGSNSSTFSLLFVDSLGRDTNLQLSTPTGIVNVSELQGTLPVNGSVRYETVPGANLVQVWAMLVHNGLSGRSGIVSGHAIFQQQVPGRPVFEAVVPFSPISEQRVRLPFDNTNGFNTGVALVNFETAASTISGIAYNEQGVSMGSATLSLPSGGQRPFVLSDLFPFTANQRGAIELTTTGRSLCSLGLRFHPGGAFTSTPPLSLPSWQ